MRFAWYIQKQEGFQPGSAETPGTGMETLASSAQEPASSTETLKNLLKDVASQHRETKEHEQDTADFLKGMESVSPEERDRLADQLEQYDQTGNVEELRRAGVSKEENEKDPFKRHALLAASFLEKAPGGGKRFMVDFRSKKTKQQNTLAEWKVGAADMLPPNVGAIFIVRGGSSIKAVRTRNPATGRIGYYDESALRNGTYSYMAIHSGDVIEVASTRPFTAKDKAALEEHRAVYEEGAMQDSASEGDELRYNPVTGEIAPDIDTAKHRRGRAELFQSTRSSLGALAGSITVPEVEGQAGELVKIALRYANSDRFAKDFKQNTNLQGGLLGCAWVASTILMEAGYLENQVSSVSAAESALLAKGWTISNAEPQAGDVVIWDKIPKQDKASGDWADGHRHIGIVVAPGIAVDNKSGPPSGPRIRSLARGGRGINNVLRPPGVKTRRPPVQQEVPEAPREKSGRNTTLAMWNKNPGNLRYSKLQAGKSEGFAYFNTLKEGWEGLLRDVRIKQSGRSKSGLKSTSTLEQFFNVYCPANDNPINKPLQYARNVANRLGIPVNTPINQVPTEELAREITRQEDNNVFAALFGKKGERKTPLFSSESGAPSAATVVKAAPSRVEIAAPQLAPEGSVAIGKLSPSSAAFNSEVRSKLPPGTTPASREPVAKIAAELLSTLQPGDIAIRPGTDGQKYAFFKEVHAANPRLQHEHFGISVVKLPSDGEIFQQGLESEERIG